jgi:hypothetical protein
MSHPFSPTLSKHVSSVHVCQETFDLRTNLRPQKTFSLACSIKWTFFFFTTIFLPHRGYRTRCSDHRARFLFIPWHLHIVYFCDLELSRIAHSLTLAYRAFARVFSDTWVRMNSSIIILVSDASRWCMPVHMPATWTPNFILGAKREQ